MYIIVMENWFHRSVVLYGSFRFMLSLKNMVRTEDLKTKWEEKLLLLQERKSLQQDVSNEAVMGA